MRVRAVLARREGGRVLLVTLVAILSIGMVAHVVETATHGPPTSPPPPIHGPSHDGSDIMAMLSALCVGAVLAVAALRRPGLQPTLPILALRRASAMPVLATNRPMSMHPPPDAGPFLRS